MGFRIGGIATLYQLKRTVRHRSSRQVESLKSKIQIQNLKLHQLVIKKNGLRKPL
ncbi:hypothetical protein D1AOALGA4SA_8489 [Olavius algarvensis Delta 1 endosymbiont]|nr:hypothetical protein D1AOALGA4SA_8489 [Olavius algarvensis Delta 1 endosymbiont]